MSDSKKNSKDTEMGADKPWWNSAARELVLTGLATVFMTEESVRKYFKDLKLPKEVIAVLLESLSKKKDDFYNRLAKEFGQVFSKVDFGKEIGRFLETHRIQFEGKVSFEKKKEG